MTKNELIAKYNYPVPRYTSYPPANFFSTDFGTTDYLKAIDESNQWEPKNISIYIHIPFCLKLCYFCGCNSFAMRNEASVSAYMEALRKEIAMVTSRIDKSREVSQIHYGGGTPNALPISYLHRINEMLFSTFRFVPNPEIAIELNPAYLGFEQMDELKRAGFNRFSIGIQDFNDEVLQSVNRDRPALAVEEIISYLRLDSPDVAVNFDFIYGLPKQTAAGFADTISKAIALKPNRLVTFSYAHVPWVNKIQERLEKIGLPPADEKMKMNEVAFELATRNGYEAIGMDHYALSNDELAVARREKQLHRNFQGYCTRRTTGQVYAFGASGISQLEGVYAQNTKSIDAYIAAIDKNGLATAKGYGLSVSQTIVREVITDLMCNEQIVWADLGKRLGLLPDEVKRHTAYNSQLLSEFADNGIISLADDKIQITPTGQPFVRIVAASFDPMLKPGDAAFSKPV